MALCGSLRVSRLGTTDYRACLTLQRRIGSLRRDELIDDTLLLTEHHPVFTLGRSADPNHLLAGANELFRSGIDVAEVERGGDVTYHGPGQLVAYPILNLERHVLDLHWYLRSLEETVIRVLADFGIAAGRDEQYTGVWVGDEKICAIGIHVRDWITTHGIALNVSVDLAPFSRIIPCGIREKGVTSMERVLGRHVAIQDVQESFVGHFSSLFYPCSIEVPERPAVERIPPLPEEL